MDRGRRTLVALVIAGVVALVLPTVSFAGPRQPETRAVRAAVRVKMVDDAFRPRSITVSKGTRVRWINRGDTAHTATSSSGLWDSGLLAPGESYSRVFRKAGSFPYTCLVHPTMRGTVEVT